MIVREDPADLAERAPAPKCSPGYALQSFEPERTVFADLTQFLGLPR